MVRLRSLLALVVVLSSSLAYGQLPGGLHGFTRTDNGLPLPGVQVAVLGVDEHTERNVVSNEHGAFRVENLKPGRYQLTASKAGFGSSAVITIEVAAQQSFPIDMALAAPNSPEASADPARSMDTPGQLPTENPDNEPLAEQIRQLRNQLNQWGQRLAVLEAKEATGATQPPIPAQATPEAETQASLPEEASPDKNKKIEPFSDWDWTWLNGNPRTKEIFWDSKFFTPEIRADVTYTYDFNRPKDHSMGGSSELFRSQEVQVEQLGVGGDFHYDNVRARLMTQFGMYSVTPRNDPSPGNGQWDLFTAYRYVSEAYGGYHFNVMHGINLDAGIFTSYIGLFSYYNFDNWAYQPSYLSSNTPWFFNGVRVQIFPTAHLKIEPWFINGWQSLGSADNRPGVGGQIKWTPYSWMNVVSNEYGLGHDDLFLPHRSRIHTDDSVEIKYYEKPKSPTLSKAAFTVTGDLGCEFGGGVSCHGDTVNGPKQSFIGYMVYNRFWFNKDLYAVTVGGGEVNNPGRYLALLPPINGEDAISAATNSPYFTVNPGDKFKAWDSSFTFDWMPKQYITFRWEFAYRHTNVPYWSGRGGITPPGGNNGNPTAYACNNGAAAYNPANNLDLDLAQAQVFCGSSGVWFPDLRKDEKLIDADILVKF